MAHSPEYVEYMTNRKPSPELIAAMERLEKERGSLPEGADPATALEDSYREVGRLQAKELADAPRPTQADWERAIEGLRRALDIDALVARAAELPLDETAEAREERILAAALEDSRALRDEDLDPATYAARWGLIGGRTFRRVSSAGAARHIRESRPLMRKLD